MKGNVTIACLQGQPIIELFSGTILNYTPKIKLVFENFKWRGAAIAGVCYLVNRMTGSMIGHTDAPKVARSDGT
ncbi:MAG TPA: hypothetical protein VE467_03065 [Chryseolinea sp.]|nr:hypothetical protein [Chryseolinea sp.]